MATFQDLIKGSEFQDQIKYSKDVLGRGGFGSVFKVAFNGKQVAVKMIPKDLVRPFEDRLLDNLTHENLVSYQAREEHGSCM